MASPEKRCLYEVLGLQLDCTADEIRSAYRKLALQRHPDKLVKSGVSEAEATASFQELVNAYEVLSDPRERAWYDSHRSQILYASSNSKSSAVVPDLFTFFSNSVFSGYSDTGKGFYKVYADIFDKIYHNELNFANKLGLGMVKEAPLMGNLKSPYAQVNAFYGYWLGFVTVMDFVWVDQFDSMAGPSRKFRRVMEEENKKLRKKARREYNETVRNLAEFVKKRDKRVIDMQVKRNEEMGRKREEEREKKKKLDREKAEKAKAYVEPEWARVEEEDGEVEEVMEEGERKNELFCVACSKKFKSDKQWKNHEQSKKHKEKVAELREAFRDEEGEHEEGEDDQEEEVLHSDEGKNGFLSADDGVDELQEQFEDGLGIQEEEEDDDHESHSTEEETVVDINNSAGLKGIAEELGLDDDDDETSVLEAMLSGHKKRKPKVPSKNVHVEVEPKEIDLMEYNNRKGSRRNRGGRKERGKRADEDEEKFDIAESSSKPKEDNAHDEGSNMEEPSSSHPREENENDSKGNADQSRRGKASKQAVDRKATNKKDMSAKLKNASKGRKQKVTSRSSGHECDTCGEDFESRNKLHKHLSDTGHASLKSR